MRVCNRIILWSEAKIHNTDSEDIKLTTHLESKIDVRLGYSCNKCVSVPAHLSPVFSVPQLSWDVTGLNRCPTGVR